MAITFGQSFSKSEWLRNNKIQDQPFFQESLPKGEPATDGNRH